MVSVLDCASRDLGTRPSPVNVVYMCSREKHSTLSQSHPIAATRQFDTSRLDILLAVMGTAPNPEKREQDSVNLRIGT